MNDTPALSAETLALIEARKRLEEKLTAGDRDGAVADVARGIARDLGHDPDDLINDIPRWRYLIPDALAMMDASSVVVVLEADLRMLLNAALALPPAGIEGSEPVAWLCEGGRERMISMDPKDAAWWRDHGFNVTPLGPLYAHPPQTQGQVSAQDGSALDARHERECLELIDERDMFEAALSQAYFLIVGESPPWSSAWGISDLLEEIDGAQSLLRRSALERGTAGEGEG